MASEQYYKDLIRVTYGLPPMGSPLSVEGMQNRQREREALAESTGGFDKEAQNILLETTEDVVAELAKRRRQKQADTLSQSMGEIGSAVDQVQPGLEKLADLGEASGMTTP
jgi:hypothetical protein